MKPYLIVGLAGWLTLNLLIGGCLFFTGWYYGVYRLEFQSWRTVPASQMLAQSDEDIQGGNNR